MFERKHEKLASTSTFAKRLVLSVLVAGGLIILALCLGVVGYHHLAGFDWIDSLLEAAMILGGMGPINPLPTPAAKLFAAAYAMFSGLVFIAVLGIMLAPATHRMLHTFHLDEDDL